MLEDILDKIGKRKIYSFFLGLLYVLISYGTSLVFFPNQISLTMIFFITLLLIPSLAKLISTEENIEREYGLNKFFQKHYVLMEVFLFLFIGIFVGYIIIGNYSAVSLDYQKTFLEKQGVLGDFINKNIEKLPQFLNILVNNVSVIAIAFVLSLFYGVGALFLIVLNASIFASFILKMTALTKGGFLFSLHFIPEVFGFLLAAMAGGVISKAIMKERVGSPGFRNVIKDGTMLLWLSLLVILLAAALEAFVSPFFV